MPLEHGAAEGCQLDASPLPPLPVVSNPLHLPSALGCICQQLYAQSDTWCLLFGQTVWLAKHWKQIYFILFIYFYCMSKSIVCIIVYLLFIYLFCMSKNTITNLLLDSVSYSIFQQHRRVENQNHVYKTFVGLSCTQEN